MKVSVIIRTYNEQRHLRELLQGIQQQHRDGFEIETIIVDSGSTDDTLKIANSFPTRVAPINKDEFSFGRSLNIGCAAASGDALVFVSGHCIPTGPRWIADLVAPLGKDDVAYTYGGQVGNGDSHFSECQIFNKYFPAVSKVPQDGFYCNNANAAMLKSVWREHRFDEDLTGLEDMHLAKRLVAQGYKLAYVAPAAVYHLHSESWAQVRRRFEREAIALQHIMPEVHLSRADVFRYFLSAVFIDLGAALQQRSMRQNFKHILLYRFMQFTGSFRGNHFHRKMSRELKESYFYPR
ncbi:MAG: glycosyltransferase [Burkholderiales bacterium]|nr:glycosyltransferase [Burkholderiales bacterium]